MLLPDERQTRLSVSLQQPAGRKRGRYRSAPLTGSGPSERRGGRQEERTVSPQNDTHLRPSVSLGVSLSSCDSLQMAAVSSRPDRRTVAAAGITMTRVGMGGGGVEWGRFRAGPHLKGNIKND